MNQKYLGDGLYVEAEAGQLRLFCQRDMEHEVFLEPEVLQSLVDFAVAEGYKITLPRPEPNSLLERMTKQERKKLAFLVEISVKFAPIYDMLTDRLKKRFTPSGAYFDLDRLSRDEVVEAMACLKAGMWTKSSSAVEGCLDYETEINDVRVRLWGAAPPGSCRIVEVEEVVPAVPEHTRTVRKLICSDATESEAPEQSPSSDEIPF